MTELRVWNLAEFARRLKAATEIPDRRFAFFLGAGCSVGAGIPSSRQLVVTHWLPRLKKLKAPDRPDTDAWVKETFPNHDFDDPARSYGAVIEALFPNPADRQAEFEHLCERAEPNFAYSVLARLVAMHEARFNVVLTTNFDDVVADALYLFTEARPLVIHHESLAAFIRPTRTRPLVVKLHGDHRLAPMNTSEEVSKVQEQTETHVRELLTDRGLIFLGYGGADEGIVKMLQGLPRRALHGGVYWVSPRPPSTGMLEWLKSRNAIWVQGGRFEDVMLLLQKEFNLSHPSKERFDKIFQRYAESFQDEQKRIEGSGATPEQRRVLDEAAAQVVETFPEEWKALLAINSLRKQNPERADAMYRAALQLHPSSAILLGSYANFLTDTRKAHNEAEEYYKQAIEAEPTNAHNLGNYAIFLKDVRKAYDEAEEYYKRAIEADPGHTSNLGNYANFLTDIKKAHTEAEKYYKRAIKEDPSNAVNLGNYARLLYAEGRLAEALQLQLAARENSPPAVLEGELWFYSYVHGPAKDQPQALKELKRLILVGVRSPGWDLTRNVEVAIKAGHEESPWLAILAQVLGDEAPETALHGWRAWMDS